MCNVFTNSIYETGEMLVSHRGPKKVEWNDKLHGSLVFDRLINRKAKNMTCTIQHYFEKNTDK